ncbi:amino acid adenylation domain-containing protein [Burkholderia gladioli]|uniref:amino acid adenylation domain-containing protein n=1 Tax=Burkholderia gladioli TaxID=28095 RepID=UPI001C5CF9ED|nr:non-ribosomal peptide synthetase [Burkholderia gladioli]MBW5281365.1 amino acid adenylation domain-containing protein [Burkholderia gladioli]
MNILDKHLAHPLSAAQTDLWIAHKLDPANPSYNTASYVEFHEPLEAAVFERALRQAIAETESLTTRFVEIDGVPSQIIGTLENWQLPVLDMSGDGDPLASAEAWMRADFMRATDLTRDPLFAYALLRVAPDRVLWYQRYHHLVADGVAASMILRRILEVYAALLAEAPLPDGAFKPLRLLLEDEAAYRESPQYERDRRFWLARFADRPQPVTLSNREAPAAAHHFLRRSGKLGRDALERLKANGVDCSWAQLLIAATAIYLHRLSGSEDIVLGLPVPARLGVARQVPCMAANVLPLRLAIRHGDTLADVLRQTAREVLQVQLRQRYRSTELSRELGLPALGQRLYGPQVNITFFDGPRSPAPRFTSHTLSTGAPTDLTISASMSSVDYESVRIDFDGHPALYSEDELGEHQQRLFRLIEDAVARPAEPVHRLGLLDEAARARLLSEWNDTDAPFPHDTLHARFAQQVARTPEAIAVTAGAASLSYAELERRANRLAHRLRALGAGPDRVIGVFAERSLAMMVALLGTLKAGAAYLPLDPEHPAERLAYLLDDARVPIVLSQAHLLERLPATQAARVTLDEAGDVNEDGEPGERDTAALAAHPCEAPPELAAPHHAAYVIYTSGSTGRPKGVLVEHRGIVNRLAWMQKAYRLDARDRVLQKTPFGFDVSVWELFWPLLEGARLVMAEPGGHRDPAYLARTIDAERISVMHFVPSMLDAFLEHAPANCGASLRDVMCSGEALRADTQNRFLTRFGARLHNLYGPTEASVDVSFWPCRLDTETASVPIGAPIDNLRLYVLDRALQPQPAGVAGELYLAGVGLARGYLNRPALTAERFVANPFTPGERMYRTGDLARWRADGQIEYLGRLDHQVKLRGLRIELGEIEAAVLAGPGVTQAAVIAREDRPGEPRLVAYVVPQDGLREDAPFDAEPLREALARALPDYMVPAAFVPLAALPLSANGKLDRRALPAPADADFARDAYAVPVGETETRLAALWAEVLGLERAGRFDHFFSQGHSLLAVRLLARVQQAFGIEIPLVELFAAPVLAQFAAALDARRAASGGEAAAVPALVPVPRGGDLPLSFAQQRLWFLSQLDGVKDTYHVPLAIRLRGALDVDAWRRALDRVYARHEALRTVFAAPGGQPRARLLPAEPGLPLLEHDLRALPDAPRAAARLAAEEARAPFDLSRGPLVRARLIRVAEQEHLFLLTQHHIVSDGWSLQVLMREIAALYGAFTAGGEDPLPPLPIQYPDYAAWQREWLSGARLEAQAAYWRSALADAPALLALPTDRPRPPQQSFAGALLPLALGAERTRALRRLSQRHGTTLFVTLLAAWAAVLGRLAGEEDLMIGIPTANRGRVELEALAGFFVNTLALRIDLSGQPDVAALLARVRGATLAAQDHQALPFEQVVEIVQPPRRLDHTPLFQAMFAWQSQGAGELAIAGLDASTVHGDYDVVKFDIELHLSEHGDDVEGALNYASALFDEASIARQRGYLLRLLDAMIADDSQAVARIDLLSEDERHLQLETWNANEVPFPAELGTHQVFEAQAARTPEAIALIHGERRLSFAELEALANRIAHRLIARGVRPGERVVIVLERGVPLVAAQLAVLKAGAAYVPINTQTPAERQAWIVEDCGAALVLTGDGAPIPGSRVATLAIGALAEPGPDRDAELPPALALSSELPAYAMYTSGSTGTPKGVLIPHRAINRLAINSSFASYGPGDRMAFCSNPAFDANTLEVWPALLNGAAVVIVDQQALLSARAFREVLEAQQVNTIWLTVGLFNQIAATLAPIFPRFKTVMVGGDTLDPAKIAEVLRGTPPQRLVNGYGPTETTVFALVHPIESVDARAIPIGRPIPNTRIYLLDADRRPVPIGAPGEIFIGGPGVGLGYLNRPELSAERFLDDPFSAVPGARMYRSGDLGRYRADGNLEFLARTDQQVKIRGFRVELGEIEARLTEHEEVSSAAVIVREDTPGDKRLAAYLTLTPGARAHTLPGRLRAGLAEVLPDYMVPSAYVVLAALPLTPNGKLDRRALPAPAADDYARETYAAPQGEVETTLAALWESLLKVERVSRFDNFFALGGHSLLAVQMIERLRERGLGTDVGALFAAPTLAALAESLGRQRSVAVPPNAIPAGCEAISPEMLPLIALDQDEIDRIVAQVPGGAAKVQDIYALSPLQEGILFHHRLAEQGDPYLLIDHLCFAERALLDRYLAAVQQVIARHDILRTAFVWEGLTQAAQVVWREAPAEITELALDPRDGSVHAQLLERYDPRHYRIELGRAPLLRFVVARAEDGRWILQQQQHHLIGDHSTQELLYGEVRALLSGRAEALLAPRPYRNLVAQARLGVSEEEHTRFFRAMLGDVTQPTLPFGLAEVRRDGSRVGEHRAMLPAELDSRLRDQARRAGVSLASLCHLAWAMVLARTSGQSQAVFGTVLFGRMQAGEGADRAMGLFINTLPLRVPVDATPVASAVRDTHARLSGLLVHEHAPLALAQRCSGVDAGTPLFSALLNYRHNKLPDADAQASGIEWLGGDERSNYPFTLSVEDYGTALGLTAQVVAPFSPERLCGYVARALEQLAAALESAGATPVAELDVLPAEERTLLLDTWNATDLPAPGAHPVHREIEAQAAATPEAIALVADEESWTYAQLNARANRLAHRLIEAGVAPDARVAICAERSPAMVLAILAVLKAGGAYVPIDVNYPAERIAHILDDAAPVLVLADAAGREALRGRDGSRVLELDAPLPDTLCAEDPHVPDLGAASLIYVIYTSGSTGKPKGVMLEHGSFRNLMHWYLEDVGLDASDRVLLASSYSFDLTQKNILGPLMVGGSLHLTRAFFDPPALVARIRHWGITHLNLSPSAFHALADADLDGRAIASLRRVVLGGEPLSLSRLRTLPAPRPEIINSYGPTECADVIGWHRLAEDLDRYDGASAPLGKPLRNARLYLLDAARRPVPLGAVGELYLGGVGVARGYLNRPELSAERFLDNPFGPGRLYRSGDLARWRADGELEYLGRDDHQVKIRGFRIEPGEIEAQLAACEGVREAAVIAREDGGAGARLVAYVVAEPDEALAAALRARLAAVLPDYMVPAAFVRLDALPLTPNGKLDRRALPAPDALAFAHQDGEAPRDEREASLAALWSELLGVERIGRHDDFFALGGHSLLAVRLLARISQTFGVTLPLSTVFSATTLARLAEALEAQRGRAERPALPPLRALPRDGGPLPLSFAQQRMWFLMQFDGLRTAYHVPLALRLSGMLDTAALRGALQRVLQRHEALRSVFVEIDGQPAIQVLPADTALPFEEHDLRGQPADRREALRARLAAEAAHAPFDFARGPLLRASLVRDEEHAWLLVLTLHHIVSDGWSLAVLLRELGALYAACAAQREDPLPALGVQYADYAAWQRGWLGEARSAAEAAHWRDTLAGAPALLALPTDRPRPPRQSFAGATVPLRLDAQRAAALARLGRKHGATRFMTLLAAWSVVLSRLSGQHDVVIGTPTANRSHGGLGSLIGLFVNTLAMRVDLSGDPDTATLLERVRGTVLNAQDHQDLPFEQVVEIVNPPRRLDHTPLFQVMFAWQGEGGGGLDLPGLRVDTETLAYQAARYDLELTLGEAGGEIVGELRYATALFDEATALRHRDYLLAVLDAMTAAPAQPVGALAMLSAAERRLLLETWNDTAAALPARGCVHQLFEQQVRATPAAIALRDGASGAALSYAELNARANRLAHRLIALGVGPDRLVAICAARGVDMVVGLLAILKAGGAYVPLDPSYPAERLAYMLEDARPVLLLADAAGRAALAGGDTAHGGDHAAALPPSAPASLPPSLALDAALPGDPADSDPAPAALDADSLAYVIYTSGSTGKPKGALNAHRGVVNRLAWMQHAYALDAGDAVLQKTPFGFDVSVWEFFWPLMTGATLVMAPPESHKDPRALIELIVAHGISTLHFVPSMLSSFLDMDEAARCTSLKRIVCSGEALPAASVRRCRRALPGAALHNLYGPTEAAIDVTAWTCPADFAGEVVPIGKPIANLRIYLLDAHGQPVPRGAAGELHIGGVGVGRGYLNRPELSAERFVHDPFAAEAGARMYRTGDLARHLPDGEIEYLGRNDHQVKIRGFRIELGEIEARLAACGLKDPVVLARRDALGNPQLVAYHAGPERPAAALRAELLRSLPDYMVPAAFVALKRLPLSPNGKLDRAALPAPGELDAARRDYVAPATPLEAGIAELWAELLQQPRVSRDDDFFELGGHSLLAIRMLVRLQRQFGVALPIGALFEAPTPAALAARVAAGEDASAGARDSFGVVLPIRAATADSTQAPLFCLPPSFGLGWCYGALLPLVPATRPIYALQSPAFAKPDAPLDYSAEALVELHLAEILRIQPAGDYHLLGWSFGGGLAHALATRLQRSGRQVRLLAMLDSVPPGHGDTAQAPDEASILAEVVNAFVPDTREAAPTTPAGPTLDQAVEQVCRATGKPREVVARLLDTTVRVTRHHAAIQAGFRLERYTGELQLFSAARGDAPASAGHWRAACESSRIAVHEIDADHHGMLRAAPLAAIVAALAPRLNP